MIGLKEGNCGRILFVCIFLIVMLICSSQAITTKDLLTAGNAKNSGAMASIAGSMNQPPIAKSLTPDVEGPLTAGSSVTWTGFAYDPEGDKLLYQFWINGPMTGNAWKPMTNWDVNNSWNWTTSPLDTGTNIIEVRVRDERHDGPWGHDSHISAEYGIINLAGAGGGSRLNLKPTILSVKSDRKSPQYRGTKVTWTAKASDPDKDTILFQFVLKGPSTEEQWLPMTNWTTSNVWTWDTGTFRAGAYMIDVWVRDGYHADMEYSDASMMTPFVVMQKAIIL